MSQPEVLNDVLRAWWASEAYKRGRDALQSFGDARSVNTMTTNSTPDPHDDFRVNQLVAGLIEDTAEGDPRSLDSYNVKDAAKVYVHTTLDNGWISDHDDTPVWELVERLGHNRDDMDSLAVYHELAGLIDACDFFND